MAAAGISRPRGQPVEKDQFVADAVVVSFTEQHLVMKSKNLPNHPTARLPGPVALSRRQPELIQEQRDTWYIPLEPRVNPQAPGDDRAEQAAPCRWGRSAWR